MLAPRETNVNVSERELITIHIVAGQIIEGSRIGPDTLENLGLSDLIL